jgi:hypothetical protein
MKWKFSLVLLVGLLSANVTAQELLQQRVTLTLEKTSLEEALYLLMDNHGIPLSFSNDILPEKQLSARINNRPLQNVLDYLFEETLISYRQVGRQLVLFKMDYRVPKVVSSRYTISGYVQDAETGERLISASVFDQISGKGTLTNEYGFFSLTLSSRKVDLNCSYLGYTPVRRQLELAGDRQININLRTSLMLTEVLVVASDSISDLYDRGYSTEWIDISEVRNLPQLGGESDIIRFTHLLPGVQTGTDGVGGIFVRGGDAGHNLVLFDGVPVYNLSHGAGLYSIFNSDVLKQVTFTKGAFPARYGGRLASVLDVRTRDGNNQTFQGQAGIGLLSGRMTLEGPIVKGKSSFLISGRWSLLDWYLRPLARRLKSRRGEWGSTGYNFYDLNAKLNFEITERDKLFFSLYSGKDAFLNYGETREQLMLPGVGQTFEPFANYDSQYREQLHWGNQIASLRWNHLFGPRLFANTTLTYSLLDVDIWHDSRDSVIQKNPKPLISKRLIYGQYHSSIEDLSARMDLDLTPTAQHAIRLGGNVTYRHFRPGIVRYDEETEELFLEDNPVVNPVDATEVALYGEDDIRVLDHLNVNVGMRASMLFLSNRRYYSLEPRFAFRWDLMPRMALRGSASVNTQYLHLLSSSNLGLPIDLWVPSTAALPPQRSRQWTLGVDRELGRRWAFSLEGYYKIMEDLITYEEGAFFLNNWENSVTTGNGEAYGVEMMLRKKSGPTTGWIAYGLSWADRQYRGINEGRRYPFKYDRRHDLKVVVKQQLWDWLNVSADWVFGTGLAYSFPVYIFDLPGNDRNLFGYDGKNNFRMPYHHRLDLALNAHFESKKLQHLVNLGLYNAYNRQNPLYYDIRTRVIYNGEGFERVNYRERVTLVPLLPYFHYSLKF